MQTIKKLGVLISVNLLLITTHLNAQELVKETPAGKAFTISKTYTNSNIDGYNLYIPNSYHTTKKAFPAIVFLQGGLGAGGKTDIIFNWELPKELIEATAVTTQLDSLKLTTFIYIMPHISRGEFYTNEEAIKSILEEVTNKYRIDKTRIYLTGLSRGGHGTWGLASRIPGIFAAIAPIAGASHGINSYEHLTKIPILTAHNKQDRVVNYARTLNSVQQIEQRTNKKFQVANTISEIEFKNNRLIFISGEDPNKGHNAWTEVYNNLNFYKWLLQFKLE